MLAGTDSGRGEGVVGTCTGADAIKRYHDPLPTTKAECDIRRISSTDVKIPIRVQEALRNEIVGLGVNLGVT